MDEVRLENLVTKAMAQGVRGLDVNFTSYPDQAAAPEPHLVVVLDPTREPPAAAACRAPDIVATRPASETLSVFAVFCQGDQPLDVVHEEDRSPAPPTGHSSACSGAPREPCFPTTTPTPTASASCRPGSASVSAAVSASETGQSVSMSSRARSAAAKSISSCCRCAARRGDHRGVEIDLIAKPEQDRVARPDLAALPVGAIAHRVDRVLGRAEQLADLLVGELRMMAQQPGDRVRSVLALGKRRVARLPALLQLDVGRGRARELEAAVRVLLAALDLAALHLPARHRIEAADAGADLAVRDALDLERVQAAEIGDLLEGQARVVHEPHGRGFRHQRSIHHLLPRTRSAARGRRTAF